MKSNQDQPAAPLSLRRRAEERLKGQRTGDEGPRAREETARLIQELHIHQIEMEMQNEELGQEHARIEALRAQYADLYDFAPMGCASLDREGVIRQVNLAGARLLGLDRSRLLKQRFDRFVAEGDRSTVRDLLDKVFASHGKECCEVTMPQAGASPLFVRIEGTRSPDDQLCLVVMVDLTERKQAEEALRESEDRYRSLVEESPDMIGIYQDNKLVFINSTGAQLMGAKTKADLLGRTSEQLIHPEDRMAAAGRIRRRLAGEVGFYPAAVRYLRLDGTARMMEVSAAPIIFGGKSAVHFIARDVTEQKKLEAQFLRAQRMESVGRLTGGIAHDLNNILAPILMGTTLLREALAPEEAMPLIDTIATSAQRGADVVKQLLIFARGTEGQKMPLPPSRLIKEMATIVQETFPKSIVLRTELPKDLWSVIGNPTQVHQILLNLCLNARDAMPEGGTLTLAAENVTLDDRHTDMSPEAKAGPYVVLQISDTGTGMSPAILDRIFEPFFTTKEPEAGTGLGLPTIQGIVKSHAGFIQVESQVGRGSHFKVYLPALPAAAAASNVTPAQDLPCGCGEWVLVVDDELSVRDITRKVLEKSGYRVLTANDGAAAVALYAQHQAEVEVVLTDLIMPVMDGTATVRVLREISPKVKIIVTSGVASKHKLAEIAGLDVQAYLQKPCAAQTLLITVDEVLHGKHTHWQPSV
ncbi:MAG: PAS domain S-box protein [Verrucomicrobiota bacterium]